MLPFERQPLTPLVLMKKIEKRDVLVVKEMLRMELQGKDVKSG
jgi:hypothetical protein